METPRMMATTATNTDTTTVLLVLLELLSNKL